jgi:hypothetical protein
MNTGLTITFISKEKNHSTIQSYNKFGNKYWDDTTLLSKSKIGYYFAYYFQKKYVYIHKIINILPPSERPIDMEWSSDKQILCLSNQLKEFTWEEWKNDFGLNSPYTPDYTSNQTTSWSYDELQKHEKFKYFNFIRLKNVIEAPIIPSLSTSVILNPTNIENEYEDKNDIEYKDEDNEDDKIIMEILHRREAKKILKQGGIYTLRLDKQAKLKSEELMLNREKDQLLIRIYDIEQEIKKLAETFNCIERGDYDDELITESVEKKVTAILAVVNDEK